MQQASGSESTDGLKIGFDLIEARYGWTDNHVFELPFARFKELIEVCAQAEAKAEKDRLIQSAFVGWQMLATNPRKPGVKFPSFNEYLRMLNLSDSRSRGEQPVHAVEAAIAISERLSRAKGFKRGR